MTDTCARCGHLVFWHAPASTPGTWPIHSRGACLGCPPGYDLRADDIVFVGAITCDCPEYAASGVAA
jgi:hypothetical protein